MQTQDLGQTAGMLILCVFFLPAAAVINPLGIAEHLPASLPAALSGLQLAFRGKEVHLQPLTVGNKQHSVIGVSLLHSAKQIAREE